MAPAFTSIASDRGARQGLRARREGGRLGTIDQKGLGI